MPLSDIANINITLASAAASRPGFGVAAIFAALTAAQTTALFGAFSGVEVTRTSFTTTLSNAGIGTSTDLHRECDVYFGQRRKPAKAILGKRATPVVEVWTVTVTGTTDGLYRVIVNGVPADFNASGDTDTDIRDGLVTALGTPADVTVAAVSTDALSLTSDNAGQPINVSVVAPGAPDLTAVISTPGTGLREDILALEAERSDWYLVRETGHLEPDIFAGALAANTHPRDIIFMPQSADSNAQTALTTDVGSRLKVLQYQRTFLGFHTNIDTMIAGALAGKMLPADPGAETWGHQEVQGVTGIVPTSSTNLIAKNYWWLESYTAAGKQATRRVVASDGTYLDLVRGRDWLKANLEIDFLEAYLRAGKIGFDDEGAAIIENVIRRRLNLAADIGLIRRDTIRIGIPDPDGVSSTDNSNRNYPGITFSATLLGAIETLSITGTLSP